MSDENPESQSGKASQGDADSDDAAVVSSDQRSATDSTGGTGTEASTPDRSVTDSDDPSRLLSTEGSPLAVAGTRLDEFRADATKRRLATLGAVVLGLAVVWLHWLGFILGGGLAALAQSSFRRGLLAGLGFGVVCWLAFALWLGLAGNLGLFLGMGQVFIVTSVIPLAGSLLGSLARGIR